MVFMTHDNLVQTIFGSLDKDLHISVVINIGVNKLCLQSCYCDMNVLQYYKIMKDDSYYGQK